MVASQGWSNKGLRDALFSTFSKLKIEMNLVTRSRDKHECIFLGDYELFFTLVKLGVVTRPLPQNFGFLQHVCSEGFYPQSQKSS